MYAIFMWRYMRTYHTLCGTRNCLTEETLWMLSINISDEIVHHRNTIHRMPRDDFAVSKDCALLLRSAWPSETQCILNFRVKCCLWGFQVIMFSPIYPKSTWREQKQLVSSSSKRTEKVLRFSIEIFHYNLLKRNSIHLRIIKDKALCQTGRWNCLN